MVVLASLCSLSLGGAGCITPGGGPAVKPQFYASPEKSKFDQVAKFEHSDVVIRHPTLGNGATELTEQLLHIRHTDAQACCWIYGVC